MKKLLYVMTGLCLLAGAFTGCEEPNENSEEGGGTTPGKTDLQILDAEGNELTELYLEDVNEVNKGIFEFKNAGSTTVEWVISKWAEEWLSFSKESGSLAPGASEQIELTIARAKLSIGEYEAVVYVRFTAGTVQWKKLKIRVNKTIPENYTETAFGMNLQMVYVDFGTFMMGATSEQGSDAWDDERPVHEVTLDGFYIGRFEVTQAQWEAVMGSNPCSWAYGLGDDYPVYGVSWEEAVAFCDSLSSKTGRKYRLPTEAEWEYAARGGQNADGTKYAGSNTIEVVAWYVDNSGHQTHPVGQKQPNGLGLYDMSGNVLEWCSDWYGSNYYSSSPATNPQGPNSGSFRVYRGGGWNWRGDARDCRVSHRSYNSPDNRDAALGLRVACSL